MDFIGSFLIADVFVSVLNYQVFEGNDKLTHYFKYFYVGAKSLDIIAFIFFLQYWAKDCMKTR